MAAEKAGRVCCGIELDPLYVDTVVRRYERATGTAATLAHSGEIFQALATSRLADPEPKT